VLLVLEGLMHLIFDPPPTALYHTQDRARRPTAPKTPRCTRWQALATVARGRSARPRTSSTARTATARGGPLEAQTPSQCEGVPWYRTWTRPCKVSRCSGLPLSACAGTNQADLLSPMFLVLLYVTCDGDLRVKGEGA
jgi:hypothetical protein